MLGVLPSLVTTDLNWCYPYMGPDSWDWLVNGLYWNGAPIDATFRPPGLPLVIAGLHRLSALPLLPYCNFGMLALAAVLLHRLVRLRQSRVVAAIAVLIFVSNGSLFGHTRFVMGEVWTLPFLIGAAIAFVHAADRPRNYLLCAALLSLSFLFHYAGAIVAAGLGGALILYRREIFSTRWPWLALAVAAPLPALWMVVRALHNGSHENRHDIVALVQPSLDNLWYYTVVAIALVGLGALPLYLVGFFRLVGSRDSRLSPWTQAVVFPCLSLAIFFALLYEWTDKRFLYYLFPFAVAIASEGISRVLAHGRRDRVRAAFATLALAVALLWTRIPYPASTHKLLALTPWTFLDVAGGIHTAQMHAVPGLWFAGLFARDNFLTFRRPPLVCVRPKESTATPELKSFLDARLAPGEPIAFAGDGGDSTSYWVDTNHLAIALERPIVKPGGVRIIVRRLAEPDPRAVAQVGPFEVFDLQAPAPHRKRRGRLRREGNR